VSSAVCSLTENTRFHRTDHGLEIVLHTRQYCYRNLRDFKTCFKMERISRTQKYLVSFLSTEVEWHHSIMPGVRSVHPWAECMKLHGESRNLLMKLACYSFWLDWWDRYPVRIMPEYFDVRCYKLLQNLCHLLTHEQRQNCVIACQNPEENLCQDPWFE
jgi:hypothetical protein